MKEFTIDRYWSEWSERWCFDIMHEGQRIVDLHYFTRSDAERAIAILADSNIAITPDAYGNCFIGNEGWREMTAAACKQGAAS
jgi:hypothetical protein